jgi:ribonuclease P protein component
VIALYSATQRRRLRCDSRWSWFWNCVSYEYPKRVRLLRASEFERVFAVRASAVDASIALHGAVNDLGHPRLGLVVSRRVGGAVARNRWKRLLREVFRLIQGQLPQLDFVCIPRAASPPPLETLKVSFLQLSARVERRAMDAAGRPSEQAP